MLRKGNLLSGRNAEVQKGAGRIPYIVDIGAYTPAVLTSAERYGRGKCADVVRTNICRHGLGSKACVLLVELVLVFRCPFDHTPRVGRQIRVDCSAG